MNRLETILKAAVLGGLGLMFYAKLSNGTLSFYINQRFMWLSFVAVLLLAMLALNPEVVFNREKLISSVWGYDFLGDSRTVDVHVTWLREKLANSSAQIKTVWGVGYKLTVARSKDQDEIQ